MVRGERRRDVLPGDMGAGMAVQQDYRRAAAAVPDPQRGLPDIDMVQRETVEHVRRGTPRRAPTIPRSALS
jgi:hypothetical protein